MLERESIQILTIGGGSDVFEMRECPAEVAQKGGVKPEILNQDNDQLGVFFDGGRPV